MNTWAKSICAATITMALSACGGGGPPKQAETPHPDLDAPPPGHAAEKVLPTADVEAEEALEKGDCATARAKVQVVLDKSPDDADAHFVLGVCAQKDGDNDAAVTNYKAALTGDPSIVAAAANLAGLLDDLKRFDEAADVARAGIAHGGKGVAELHVALADAFKGQGKHDLAAKSYENAIKIHGDDAQLYLWEGEQLVDAGDKTAALRAYRGAVTHAKDDVSVLELAAIGLEKAGDPTACVAALDKAMTKEATAPLLARRGVCKHAGGDLPGARADLDASIAKSPTFGAQAAAGKYAEEAGDKQACREHYLAAAKIGAGKPVEKEAKERAAHCSK